MLSDLLKNYDVILASGSPRRQQLLREMGIDFKVVVRQVEEKTDSSLTPREAVVSLSRLKMSAFRKSDFNNNRLIITADTIVAIDNRILGKPENRTQAIEILTMLSGKCHDVITGVCIKTAEKEEVFTATTRVCFKELSMDEVVYYIDNYKPYDKAGAYGIQEWIGHAAVERIEGSYFNVMGLPTHKLYEKLRKY